MVEKPAQRIVRGFGIARFAGDHAERVENLIEVLIVHGIGAGERAIMVAYPPRFARDVSDLIEAIAVEEGKGVAVEGGGEKGCFGCAVVVAAVGEHGIGVGADGVEEALIEGGRVFICGCAFKRDAGQYDGDKKLANHTALNSVSLSL